MRSLSLVLLATVACGPSASSGDDDGGLDLPRTCLEPDADRTDTRELADALGTVRVTADDVTACTRRYALSSTAARRDDLPSGDRVIEEAAGRPTLRSGNDLLDALHALALEEVRENSVEAIRDGAFAQGSEIPCGEGGCFETGRLWTYVWTRDLAYAVDLGLASLDPARARTSLAFKLSGPRTTTGAEQVVQDTGTGGSYPVSSDRVVWALGAAATLPHLDDETRAAFGARAFEALAATLEHDRGVVFDEVDGLYTGEQSFLDWREQSYPAWTADDVAPIASSKALSTNILHLRALEITADLANAHGDAARATRYRAWADALRERIRARFWLEDAGLFSTFVTTQLDPAPARQFDLLGNALAVLAGVATPAQADRILASYPHIGPGAAPVIFPQQQRTAIYHNRAEWPFVTAYWLRAAAAADHPAVATRALGSLVRAAALNLSNMENLEIATGAPWVQDGSYSGPVVNSHRQLWSVAGFVSAIHHTLFGLHVEADGLRVAPYLTTQQRETLFAGTDMLVLNDARWGARTITVVLHLPPIGGDGSYGVREIRLNGVVVTGAIDAGQLDATNRIDVQLAAPDAAHAPAITRKDATSWREIFAPRVPAITGVSRSGGNVALALFPGGEDTSTIRYQIYRDGTRVGGDLAGTATSFTDATANAGTSVCYAIETCFTSTGNCSQRSKPTCWWGDGAERVHAIPASAFTVVGGTPSNDHGRFHHGSWGAPGDTITIPDYRPAFTGAHLIQAVYGNGAGPLNTGITCALKRVTVIDNASSAEVASGVLVMPQLGSWSRWADSTFVRANLDATKSYRITLTGDASTRNMSAFSHFTHYIGTGGSGGEHAHVNIAELKVLSR